jgi:hypothetical protein
LREGRFDANAEAELPMGLRSATVEDLECGPLDRPIWAGFPAQAKIT